MELELNKRQMDVLTSKATEILYGGAAGGGKSYLLRGLAVALCYDIPGLQVYLFRRTYPDLLTNHMNGYMCFPEMLAPFLVKGQCKINYGAMEIVFWNGSKIHLCHCQHEKDVTKYQGAEIHVLMIDELTHFSEYIYRFLRNRVRVGGLPIPEQWRHKIPMIVNGSNPGSVGHAWVKRSFIDMAAPYECKQMEPKEGGMLRQYIPAKLTDNPVLMRNDPGYIDRLSGLGSDDLVRAMREGDWDIVAGAAFEQLNRDTHMIRPFAIPEWWTRFTSLDWGSSKPYAVGWFTICDEALVIKGRDGYADKLIGKGSIICYRELYGWNGKPDEGCREQSWEVAKKIADLENERITYRIADSAMWAEHDGPSIAERMMDALDKSGATCPNMEQSRKDRRANYLEIRNRLSLSDGENPGFYVFDNCHHFWRTVPDLQLDEREPEKGWDTKQEDHWCFEAGTLVMTMQGGRPIEQIKTNDIVLTSAGWKRCISLGQTGVASTFTVTLSDGFSFKATGAHPILTTSGTFARLDSLSEGDVVLCASQKYLIQSKNSWGNLIGYAAIIFSSAVKDCIALFGNIIAAIFQKASMFTIKIITKVIIRLKTWSCLVGLSIYLSTWLKGFQIQKRWKRLGDLWILLESALLTGTKAKKGENGIAKLPQAESTSSSIKRNASIAGLNLWQLLRKQCSALTTATLSTTEKRILAITPNNNAKPVYNLSVPGVENYALGNGLIVHNCDMLAYALASRPTIMDRITYVKQEYDEARRKSFEADRGSVNVSRY